MQHIKKEDRQEFTKGSVSSAEYGFTDASLNLSPIHIEGRYPESGYALNTVSDSVIHVLKGQGEFHSKNGDQMTLKEGDQVHIAPHEAYVFEGTLDIVYAATPPWTPDQAELVD